MKRGILFLISWLLFFFTSATLPSAIDRLFVVHMRRQRSRQRWCEPCGPRRRINTHAMTWVDWGDQPHHTQKARAAFSSQAYRTPATHSVIRQALYHPLLDKTSSDERQLFGRTNRITFLGVNFPFTKDHITALLSFFGPVSRSRGESAGLLATAHLRALFLLSLNYSWYPEVMNWKRIRSTHIVLLRFLFGDIQSYLCSKLWYSSICGDTWKTEFMFGTCISSS